MSLLNQGFNRWETITKSDTVAIPTGLTDAIYVGTKGATGTVVAVTPNGDTCTFVGLLAGTIYPLRVVRINNTTTDASDLVALYIQ
jgi:uncharacterized protein involved in response to NO